MKKNLLRYFLDFFLPEISQMAKDLSSLCQGGPAGGLNNYSICTSCVHHVKTKTYNIAVIGDPVHLYIYIYMYVMIFVHNDQLWAVQIDY